MATQAEKAERFLALHQGPSPLVMPNPWDQGSAKLLASMGFEALATTSGGFAATLGRLDGSVTRDEAVAHAAAVVAPGTWPLRPTSGTASAASRRPWPRPSFPGSRPPRPGGRGTTGAG